jgi:hypothetical protein
MTMQRRDFFGCLGGASLFALGAAPAVPRPGAARAAQHPTPVDEKFDVSWADRLTQRFRAVFDSPEISEGAALYRAMIWCDEYRSVYGTARSEMSPVLVMRHSAIHLAMNDTYWKRFKIGKAVKLKTFEGKKWAEVNPIRVTPPDAPPEFAKYNLENFLAEGGVVLACGVAFADVVAKFKSESKLDDVAARKIAVDHLIPGVVLQPSGVFAVLRAQEAGCKYILAS